MKNRIKLFGIIAMVAIIGFSMAACSDGSSGGGSVTSVTITGLSGKTGNVRIQFHPDKASYSGSETETISIDSVTFTSPTQGNDQPIKSGSYYLWLEVEGDSYAFTNGTGSDGFGSGSNIVNADAVKIALSGDVTIDFDKFKKN